MNAPVHLPSALPTLSSNDAPAPALCDSRPLDYALCRCIGNLIAAQRSMFRGFPASDPEVAVHLRWAEEYFAQIMQPLRLPITGT
ncbi:hypothetical protein SAMN06265378_10985 [Paracoccus sediminis]|uniref:Uncharacterized protein n=1 Tax=Paracoccus sediminis TaxID=1214787 RepID=A0A238XDW0_9RHOB|nr:hypothetical protein SAMN06265378_10985 [Paracoccus sediminis]